MPETWKDRIHAFHFHPGAARPDSRPVRLAAVERLRSPGTLPAPVSVDASLVEHLTASRSPARRDFYDEVRRLRDRLRDLLTLESEDAPLQEAMGAEGGIFFQAGTLARALRGGAVKSRCAMDPGRRARVESALAVLDAALPLENEPVRLLGGETAIEQARAMAGQFSELLRAVRTARLESERAFDERVHADRIRLLDWRSATADELRAMPMPVVVEDADNVSVGALSGVLTAGLPVKFLLFRNGPGPDLGYIALGHRECFVVESSASCPDHLRESLRAMGASLRPGVALVTADPLLHAARLFPAYVYDPEAGESWAERLKWLARDPVDVRFDGQAETLTPAHAVWPGHLATIPDEAWDPEQLPLSEYLSRWRGHPPKAIPYLWAREPDGSLRRAVVSAELAALCRDRQRAWRFVEELAGVQNSHVEAAVAAARVEMERECAARVAAAAGQAKADGATIAVQRVVALLTSSRGPGNREQTRPGAVSPPAEVAPPPVPAAAAGQQPAAEPYIDSFLCTSCNDCMKINPRMFQYNSDKQAYIADASAGTFAELVRAAEGCPAHCIHVGEPRPGDPTATPALCQKAAKLR